MTRKEKLVITELKRIQEIMGVENNLPILLEQPKPLLTALKSIFTNAEPLEKGAIYQLTYNGKPLKKLANAEFQELKSLVSKPNFKFADITDDGLRLTLKQIVQSNEELQALAEKTIQDIAKSQGKTVSQLMKEFAQDYIDTNAENYTPEEWIKSKLSGLRVADGTPNGRPLNIDDGSIELIENYLVQQLKKFVPEIEVAGRKISAASNSWWTTGPGAQLKSLGNALLPYYFKNLWYKFVPWATEILPNKLLKKWKIEVPSIVDDLEGQVAEIMRKQQTLDPQGEEMSFDVLENLDNMWAIISRGRKSMMEQQYKQMIQDWFVTNSAIPKKELEVFLNNPGVKKVMETPPEYLTKKMDYIFMTYLKAHVKKIPIVGATLQAIKNAKARGGIIKSFKEQDFFEFIPRLKNEILYKTPLTKAEMMELGMRTTKAGTIIEFAFIYLIWVPVVENLIKNYFATIYQNYFVIDDFNKELERYRQLCKVGLIEENGKPIPPSECNKRFAEIKRTTWDGMIENVKANYPFRAYIRDVKEGFGEGIPEGLWNLLLNPATRIDELYSTLKKSVSEGESVIPFERWKDEALEPFEPIREDMEKQLRSLGLPVDNEKELDAATAELIRKQEKENPELRYMSGNLKENLVDFKKFLTTPPNTMTMSSLTNAAEMTDNVGKYYLIDKTKPVDIYDNPKFRFFEGTFTQDYAN